MVLKRSTCGQEADAGLRLADASSPIISAYDHAWLLRFLRAANESFARGDAQGAVRYVLPLRMPCATFGVRQRTVLSQE